MPESELVLYLLSLEKSLFFIIVNKRGLGSGPNSIF